MKIPRVIFFAVMLGVFPNSTRAAFTIFTEYANLFQANGVTQIDVGVVGILVADEGTTSGIVNAGNTVLSVGNYLGGNSDDRIIGTFKSIADVSGKGVGFQNDFQDLIYSGNFNVGDNLYFLWFPSVTVVGSTLGGGVSYGEYRTDAIDTFSGATIAFIAPSDGGTYNMSAYLNSIFPGSGVTDAEFTASKITAVPEPSTYALLGVAVLGAALMRKKRNAC